jgi:hypothetical protein
MYYNVFAKKKLQWVEMEVNVQGHAPAALFPGKAQVIPTEYGAGWAQDGEWAYWKREIFFFLSQK